MVGTVIAAILGGWLLAVVLTVGTLVAVRFVSTTASVVDIDQHRLTWHTLTGEHRCELSAVHRVRPAPMNRSFLLVEGDGVRFRMPPAPGLASVLAQLRDEAPGMPIELNARLRQLESADRNRRAVRS